MRKQYQVSYVVNGQEIWSEVFKADGYTDALKKAKTGLNVLTHALET